MRRSTTQIFVASTLYGVMNLAAAVDDDLFGGGDRSRPSAYGVERVRRLLLISNNATLPEITGSAAELPGFDLLAKRFDRVLRYNTAIEPFHPSSWSPRPIDAPLWQRYLRQLWELADDDIQLVVESLQVNPAQAICRIFTDARIDVYADGLMSYGPTRSAIPAQIGTRIERLLYADLVPGLRPLLLGEWQPEQQIIDTQAIRRTVAEVAASQQDAPVGSGEESAWSDGQPPMLDEQPVALLLGQYLSSLGIVTGEEEEELHRRMLISAVARGHRRVIFKPHPNAPRELADSLRLEADRRGVDLIILADGCLAETLFARLRIAAVIGCFSTAMITAATFYRIPVFRVGTTMVLDRLTPYHNSNRIPATIVRALVRPAEETAMTDPEPSPANQLPMLVGAVSYVMQPDLRPDLRAGAADFLQQHYDEQQQYFRRRRLTTLELPGGFPARRPGVRAVLRAGLRVRPTWGWRRAGALLRGRRRATVPRPRSPE